MNIPENTKTHFRTSECTKQVHETPTNKQTNKQTNNYDSNLCELKSFSKTFLG